MRLFEIHILLGSVLRVSKLPFGFEGRTAHTSLRSMAVFGCAREIIKAGSGEQIGAGAVV